VIVLTPHTRLRALASTTAGRASIARLLGAVVPLLADQEHAASIVARAAADQGWQNQFEASGDMLNALASQLNREMPAAPASIKHGTSEWYAEMSRRHTQVRDALNAHIDAAERVPEPA
jgi:hypothetical protein